MRLFLFLVLPVFCSTVTAQHKQFERHLGWNGNFVLLHSVTNKQQACTFVLKADSVKAFLSNADTAFSEIYCIPRAVNENYLGAFIRDRKVYLYMDNGDDPGIRCWLYDMETKTTTQHHISFSLKGSRIINRLSSDNYFFYFTYNKKNAAFVIYKFSNEQRCDTLRYVDNSELWKI